MTNLLKLLSLKNAVKEEVDRAEVTETEISLASVVFRYFLVVSLLAFLVAVFAAHLVMSTLVFIYGIR